MYHLKDWNDLEEYLRTSYDSSSGPQEIAALLNALDLYFESDTYVRYLGLLKAARKVMPRSAGWAAGYRLLGEHKERAEKVWGVEIPDDEIPWDEL
jgi:hypothetical protein